MAKTPKSSSSRPQQKTKRTRSSVATDEKKVKKRRVEEEYDDFDIALRGQTKKSKINYDDIANRGQISSSNETMEAIDNWEEEDTAAFIKKEEKAKAGTSNRGKSKADADEDSEGSIGDQDGSEEDDDGEESDDQQVEVGPEDDDGDDDEEDLEPEDDSLKLSVPRRVMLDLDITRYRFQTYLDAIGDAYTSKISVRASMNKFNEFRDILKSEDLVKKWLTCCFEQFWWLSGRWQFNGQLVHSMLLHRIVNVGKKHEMWFLVDRKPVRFGLQEFALMTGLMCNNMPSEKRKKQVLKEGKGFYKKVAKTCKKVTGDALLDIIQSKRGWSKDEKLKLSMVWFVHTMLIARDGGTAVDQDWIMMSNDLLFFNNYPWGKKSFDLTLDYLKNKHDLSQHYRSYSDQKKRGHGSDKKKKPPSYCLFGFPWAFLAWIYEVVPYIGRKAGPAEDLAGYIPRMLKYHRKDASTSFDPLTGGPPNKIKVVHPVLYPTNKEVQQHHNKYVTPYDDETDESIDELLIELEGITVLKTTAPPLPPPPFNEDVNEDVDLGGGDGEFGGEFGSGVGVDVPVAGGIKEFLEGFKKSVEDKNKEFAEEFKEMVKETIKIEVQKAIERVLGNGSEHRVAAEKVANVDDPIHPVDDPKKTKADDDDLSRAGGESETDEAVHLDGGKSKQAGKEDNEVTDESKEASKRDDEVADESKEADEVVDEAGAAIDNVLDDLKKTG